MRTILVAFGLGIAIFVSSGEAIGAGLIVYQGILSDSNSPVNGDFEMRFGVYDTPTNGSGTLLAVATNSSIAVSNGLFTADVDVSPNIFDGGDRWLEIGTRPKNSDLAFSILSPRQRFAPTPYAIHATSAAGVTGVLNDSQLSTNVARLNISNQVFTSSVVVNGTITSSNGGFRFPDGTVQTTAATTPKIVASINVNFSLDHRTNWTRIEDIGDDNTFINIPLGFTYTGFGANTPVISFSSNGLLFFGTNANVSWSNTSLPSPLTTNAMVAFFWDDLQDTSTNEFAEYTTIGTTGGRVFNLYFKSRFRTGTACSDTSGIGALVSIHEGSNLIKVTYTEVASCVYSRGAGATIGFQTAGGASSTPFIVGFNSPILDDSNAAQTISFHPSN